MKKIFLALVAITMCINASAFKFDGIDLNKNYFEIAREISAKGYVYDDKNDCLTGNCQGTTIVLRLVAEKTKLSQLIVDVPMTEKDAAKSVEKIFTVVYHLISSENGVCTYSVDEDGTTLAVSNTANGIRLTYNTPNAKK